MRCVKAAGAWGGRDWDQWCDGTESLGVELDGEHSETLPSGQRVTVRNTRGETLGDVAARARAVVDEVLPRIMAGEDVLLVAHAHILRVLTTQWIGVDPHMAKLLRFDTAHYSVLSIYKGDRVIDPSHPGTGRSRGVGPLRTPPPDPAPRSLAGFSTGQ